MQQVTSEITHDMQELHKEALRNSVLSSTRPSSLLGGEPVREVIQKGHYTPLSVRVFKGDSATGDCEILEDVLSREFPPGSEGRAVVLYGGVGMGKTTVVEKVIWDWTSGTHMQHYAFLLRVCVRQLSALGEKTESLKSVLSQTHTHLSEESLSLVLQRPQSLLLVLDGLDHFQNLLSTPSLICDAQEKATGSVLLNSLLHGSLLPGASMLVTSREALPLESARSMEVVGFSLAQRRMFFQQFFGDGTKAERLLWNTERSLGLQEQCYSPSFCWTLCSVFKAQLEKKDTLPETLTHLCCLITHMLLQKHRMNAQPSRELLCGLGKLASLCSPFTRSTTTYNHTICSYNQITDCGLQSFLDTPVLSAFLCIIGDDVISPETTFSFLSPVMQEFLLAASFYIDQSEQKGIEIVEERSDVYHTFLAGLSDPGQCKPLKDFLGGISESRLSEFSQWLMENVSTVLPGFNKEQHFRIFHLLQHTRSSSVVRESISRSQWRTISYSGMQEADYTALSYVVSCVGEMQHMNLYRGELTEEQVKRLCPALLLSKNICLSQSHLSLAAFTHLASVLAKGQTTTLDLSKSRLVDEAVKTLCHSLTHATLQSLQLGGCSLTAADCVPLAEMLSGGSKLCVLDLSGNNLEDQGAIQLSSALGNSRLQEVNLDSCSLTAASMPALSSALRSGHSEIRVLNLSRNSITDDGMELLSQALQTDQCRLNTLKVSDCELTDSCCSSLAAALQSENACLTELNLSVNELDQSGASLICEALRSPNCTLETLEMTSCELTEYVFGVLGSVLTSGVSRLVSLSVGLNKVGNSGAKHMWNALRHKSCKLQHLDLEMLSLTDECVEELCQSVASNSTLSTLILKNNNLTDSSVPRLVKLMQDHPIMSELNLQDNDFSEDVSELMDSCPNIKY